MNAPNFFIVGAPKCGTTAMNDYLNQHPDIFMAEKELHYFGKDLKIKNKLSPTEYLQQFNNIQNEKIIGEASVWYLYSKTAAEEIKIFCPGAKILIMLRNPVEVLHSLHSQNLFDGNEDVFDFEKAVSLDEERKKGNKLPNSLDFTELPLYIDSVLFYEQVKRYLDVFGRANVNIILYDDFEANSREVVIKTFRFLNVNDEIEIDYGIINPNKRIKLFFIHRLLKNPSSKLKKLVRIIIPFKKIRHAVMVNIFSLNVKVKKRNKINNSLNTRLKSFVADDIYLLSKLINRNLSKWLL